ncbi:MAG TPA: hypothetical protein VN522_14495 [Solirubrobacterales bacterium]|nr:hypothetical protein [Solirubrobacterales bacterium]
MADLGAPQWEVERRRFAKRIAFWIAVLLGVLLPLGIVTAIYWHSPHIAHDLLIGVSVGVSASAAWWAFFSHYAERQARLLLTTELAKQRTVLDRGISELIEEAERNSRRWQDERLPLDLYASNNGTDLRFNRDVTRDLARSKIYYFSGPTGIYVPARIETREVAQDLRELRLRLIDPCSPPAMKRAVEERLRRDENAGRSEEEIREKLELDLIMVHVALWRIRKKVGRIALCYENVPVLNRVEMFDDCIYDSSIEKDGRSAFPTTARWGRDHSTWTLAEQDFKAQEFTSFMLRPSTSEDDLRVHLKKQGMTLDRDFDSYLEEYDRRYASWMRETLKEARDHRDVVDEEEDDPDE